MQPLTVTELTQAIKALVEPNFREVSVQGEISNLKQQASGHFYFSLKDASSQISAVLFKGYASQLQKIPKEGDRVTLRGELSLYVPRGQYQLVVKGLEFLGKGELLLKLQQLKETLQMRGWFDPKCKKPLPKLPKRIGVITSPTGAVIQDILNVLTRRFSGFHLILNPVKVQGEGAKDEIAKAIDQFNQYDLADVLIVGRGGGSIEDLWAFNEEIVVEAIFKSKIPIISAVGHETDFTLADFAADVRAPTPSAAAEIAMTEKEKFTSVLVRGRKQMEQSLLQKLKQNRQHLNAIQKHPLLSSPYSLLSQPIQKLDSFRFDIESAFRSKITKGKMVLTMFEKRLESLKPMVKLSEMKKALGSYQEKIRWALMQLMKQKKEALLRRYQHLLSVNPKEILKRGYAVLFSEIDNSIILSSKETRPSQKVSILLHDGKALATVNSVEVYEPKKS